MSLTNSYMQCSPLILISMCIDISNELPILLFIKDILNAFSITGFSSINQVLVSLFLLFLLIGFMRWLLLLRQSYGRIGFTFGLEAVSWYDRTTLRVWILLTEHLVALDNSSLCGLRHWILIIIIITTFNSTRNFEFFIFPFDVFIDIQYLTSWGYGEISAMLLSVENINLIKRRWNVLYHAWS